MNTSVFENQYGKTLNMLSDVIRAFDSSLWFDEETYQYPSWRIAYHGVYFANIYCSPKEESIVRWTKERPDYHFLGTKPWPPFEAVKVETAFSKEDMIEFVEFVRSQIPGYLRELSPDDKCWPRWYDETQLEFQINSIRHLQHHTAELMERRNNVSTVKYLWQ